MGWFTKGEDVRSKYALRTAHVDTKSIGDSPFCVQRVNVCHIGLVTNRWIVDLECLDSNVAGWGPIAVSIFA